MGDVRGPSRFAPVIEVSEKFVSVAPGDLVFRDPRENHAIGGFVGAVAVLRIDVHIIVAGTDIILSEVQKRGTSKTVLKFPFAPPP